MTTLGIMVDRIADELSRDDLKTQTEAAVRSAVNNYAGERWWFNEVAALTITLTPTIEFYPLPDDFEAVDAFSVLIGGNLLDIDERSFNTINTWQTNNVVGQPTDFAIYGNQLDIFPIPNDTFLTVLSYVQSVSTLTTTTCTNTFMTYGEELIRSRARADIQLNFLRDEGVTSEYLLMLQTGSPFYSLRERAAYQNLKSRNTRRLATNRIRQVSF